MKILAINSSPRKHKSNTDRILKPFLEGAREAGAETEIEYLQGKKIKPCIGCYKCWMETPGLCVQKDDMADLLEKLRGSDIVVYATPLYIFGMNAQMKAFFDRMIPVALPFIALQDGHCTHPFRHERKATGMVVISNCGFYELDNFNEMVAHFKIIAYHSKINFLGALLRPEGEFLPFAEKLLPDTAQAIYDAAREAGRQVVRDGAISEEVLKAVSRQMMSIEEFVEGANAYFEQMTKEITREGKA